LRLLKGRRPGGKKKKKVGITAQKIEGGSEKNGEIRGRRFRSHEGKAMSAEEGRA